MSSQLVIGIVLLLIIASLGVSAVTYARQQALAKRQSRVRYLKQQADELLAARATLLNIDPDYELITLLQRRALHFYRQACELIPLDKSLQSTLQTQSLLLAQLERQQRDNEVVLALTRNEELNQALYQLTQLPRLLEQLARQAVLTHADSERLQAHLRQLRFDLEINSLLEQANQLAEKGDHVMYQVRVKQVREILKKTSLPINNLDERVNALSEALIKAKESHDLTRFEPTKN